MPPESAAAAAPIVTIAVRDFVYIAPEIVLAIWGLLVLFADVALMRRRSNQERRRILGSLALTGSGLALVAVLALKSYADALTEAGWLHEDPDPLLFFGTPAGDVLTSWMNLVLVIVLAMVLGLSRVWSFTEHWGEYYALMIWATVGMMLLVAADELLTLFLTLEMMTLCLYLVTAIETSRHRSPEAGLKYFVYGSVSSALFLFGLSLLYGLTGTTRLESVGLALSGSTGLAVGLSGNLAGAMATLLVLAGFGFKIAAAPFHQWAPDAYEGAPAPVGAWIASGSKIASFIALMKVLNWAMGPWAYQGDQLTGPGWIGILALLAAVSMTYGNLAALAQRNFKRLLAYSAIAHAGYMLIGIIAVSVKPMNQAAAGAVLFYLIVYSVTIVGAFAVAGWLARDLGSDDIDDLNGLGARAPGLAVCVALLMLSLIGIPPLAGFFGKLYLFMEALNTHEPGRPSLTWLVALALLNTVISAFYYVRVLKAMFLRSPRRDRMREAPAGVSVPIVFSTLLVIGFGLAPSTLLETMKGAALPMLSTSGAVSRLESPPPQPYQPDPVAEELKRRFPLRGAGAG